MNTKVLPKKGDFVLNTNGWGLYNPAWGLSYATPYEVLEDVQQDVWKDGNGIPFYPELKVLILNDHKEKCYYKLSRFCNPSEYKKSCLEILLTEGDEDEV